MLAVVATISIGATQAGSTPVAPPHAAAPAKAVHVLSDNTYNELWLNGDPRNKTVQYGDSALADNIVRCPAERPSGTVTVQIKKVGDPDWEMVGYKLPLKPHPQYDNGSWLQGLDLLGAHDRHPGKYVAHSSFTSDDDDCNGSEGETTFTILQRDIREGAWTLTTPDVEQYQNGHLYADYVGKAGSTPPGADHTYPSTGDVEFEHKTSTGAWVKYGDSVTPQWDSSTGHYRAVLDHVFTDPTDPDHPELFRAHYQGDVNYTYGYSNESALQVRQIQTSTTLTSDANPADLTHKLNLKATVTVNSAAGTQVPAKGTIAFKRVTGGPETVLGVATVDEATSSATFEVDPALLDGAGVYEFRACYRPTNQLGDSCSEPPLLQRITKTVTTTTLTANPTGTQAGEQITFTANVTTADGPLTTGSVVFSVEGKPGTPTTAGTDGTFIWTVSDLAVGSHRVVATFGGTDQYETSTSTPEVTVAVGLIASKLTLTVDPATSKAGSRATFTAALDTQRLAPKQKVTFTVDGHAGGTATIDDHGRATWNTTSLKVGSHQVVARYAGDATHAAATSKPVHVQVMAVPVTHDPATGQPGSGGSGGSDSPPAKGGGGGLASTGADALGITVLALGLLAAGLGLVGLGRSRRSRSRG